MSIVQKAMGVVAKLMPDKPEDPLIDAHAAVGRPFDRVDGPPQVAGTARFAAEVAFDGLVHCALVCSTVAKGRIASLALTARYGKEEFGYAKEMSTRPQTVGYGLSDSPAGQAAWIYEKLHGWSDSPDGPEALFGMDAMLDNVMLYWLPNAGASSARLYWESLGDAALSKPINIPVGVSVFPRDINKSPRRWAERYLRNIVHWNEAARGGHFGAFEQPELFVRELRDCFRNVR